MFSIYDHIFNNKTKIYPLVQYFFLLGYRFFSETLHFHLPFNGRHVFIVYVHIQLQRCDGTKWQRRCRNVLGIMDNYADGQIWENALKRSDNDDYAMQTSLLFDSKWIFPYIFGNLHKGRYNCERCVIQYIFVSHKAT